MGRHRCVQRAQPAGARRDHHVGRSPDARRQAVVSLTGPIIGVSRRAHRVGSGRRHVRFFETNLSAIEQLRLIIIGATLGVVVGILVIVPEHISSGVAGVERSSPATRPPARTSAGPAGSPTPILATQRPRDVTASVAPTQRPQASSAPTASTLFAPTAPASSPLVTSAPASTPIPTFGATPTPTPAPTSLIPTLPPLPTLPTPTLPSIP